MTTNTQVNNQISVTSLASAIAKWDANKNLSANSLVNGYRTTATAAGTTTLTVADAGQQFFTGSTTQTVVLPVTSTLVLGQAYYIVNNSTGVVTVQSSGGNTVQAMAGSTTLLVTCILTSGTTAASWSVEYVGAVSGGTVNSGTLGQIAYYAATGNTISGTNTIPNTVAKAGITNGSSPSAGNVGEATTSTVLSGSGVTLTTATNADVTSISLQAGIYIVWGNVSFSPSGGTSTLSSISPWISTTSATLPDIALRNIINFGSNISAGSGMSAPMIFLNISAPTTVYLSCRCSFNATTCTASGSITALRVA